jgi:serine/threonine protein phosphatase PrpC
LSGQVSDERICEIVAGERDLMAVAKLLVEESNKAGGEDNVTVVIVSLQA